MKKLILTFGTIAGLVVTGSMLLSISLMMDNSNFDIGEIIGYLSMIIAFSTIFFAIKSYRDVQGKGRITFGKGFLIGLYITLVAATVYVVGWEIYYASYGDEFSQKYAQSMIDKAKAGGATPAAIRKKVQDMEEFKVMYDNPIIRVGMTFVEILPVGILVAIISAAILRKREILPA
jgi:hypothetical protein